MVVVFLIHAIHPMTDTRLVDIETKLAYQEATIDELTLAMNNQAKRIEQLEATCKLLIERISDMSPRSEPGSPADEKPPHY